MFDKFQNIISKIILICLAIFTTLMFVQAGLFYGSFYVKSKPVSSILVFLCAIIAVVVVGYLLYKIRDDDKKINNWLLVGMLVVFLIVGLVWLSFVPNKQVSDFLTFWKNAKNVLDGTSIYKSDNDYFAKWAYQTGYLVYVSGVVKLFGYHIFVLQFLNLIYETLILLVTYKLTVKIFNNIKAARLAVLLLMINLDWFSLSSQNNNQYLGSLLFLTTFYLLMHDKYWHYILAGITLALGSIIRPIGPVIIAGIVVFAILYRLYDQKKFNWPVIGKIVLTLAIYLAIFSAAGMAIKSSGLNEYGLSNRDSEWKLVTGLDYNSHGSYDQGVVDKIDMKQSRNKVSKQEYKIIHEQINYLNSNHKWIQLFWYKFAVLWSNRSTAIDFTNVGAKHSPTVVNVTNIVSYLGSVLTIIFAWIGSLKLFKLHYNKDIFLLILPLMAYAVVQLLIEVQGRYRTEFTPILAIIASIGLVTVCHWINSKWGKGKQSV